RAALRMTRVGCFYKKNGRSYGGFPLPCTAAYVSLMNRRNFLQHAGAASAGLVLAKPLLTKPADDWRRFEVMTRVEILKPVGATRVWVPAALTQQTPYQQTLANTFNAPGAKARFIEHKDDALGFVDAEFPAGVAPVVTMMSRVAT